MSTTIAPSATSLHAAERLVARLSPEERVAIATAADRVAARVPSGSAAIRLCRLGAERAVDPAGMLARGDSAVVVVARQDVVAIVRDGRVATIMLRRERQPFTAEALRVDRVAIAS